jgi:hypothetical protein
VRRTVTVAAPPHAIDRVQVAVTRPGPLPLPRGAGGTYGVLLLNGHAWRGAGAGRIFGVDLTPSHGTSVRRIVVDAAAETTTRMRADVAWTADSADAVTLSTGLAGQALRPGTDVAAGGHASFLDRPDISVSPQPSAFSALVRTSAGASLATVRLPWPV